MRKARKLLLESLSIHEELEKPDSIASSVWALGNVAHQQQRFDVAQRDYQNALELFTDGGDLVSVAGVVHDLGRLAHDQGDFEEAASLYEHSLELSEETGSVPSMAATLTQLALLFEDLGQPEAAAPLWARAAALLDELESPHVDEARDHLEAIREGLGAQRFREIIKEAGLT